MSQEAIVYTTIRWVPCEQVKEFLSQHGIPYVEKNVRLDPVARQELLSRGYRSAPVTVINGQWLMGFNPEALRQALGL